MATSVGQRFVRRHNAARGSTSNTTGGDLSYDTAVLSEGGYSWSSPDVTVDESGLYLCIFDMGQVDLASTRAVGTLVPKLNNTTDYFYYRAQHRYLRNSGGAQHGTSWGAAILDLTANDDIRIHQPGTTLSPTDAVGSYATNLNYGGALQMIKLPDDTEYACLHRTSNANEPGVSNINTTRPWLAASGTWGDLTHNVEVTDTDNRATSAGITVKNNEKVLICWGATLYSSDASRHTYVTALNIDGTRVQTASGYQRNTASQGPPHGGMYLYENDTGGDVTVKLQATQESEGADAGTPVHARGYLQVIVLPSSAEWIHVDNGATDSLTTALAGTSTWYDTPLSSTLRADGNSDLSLDGTNDAVQNDSGASMPVLAIGWHRWDRDSGSSGTRKNPWCRWDNGGSAVGYGISGAFSRGQQSGDDTWQAHYVSAVTLDLANGADLSFQVNEEASGSNSDMGIYASTSRYFLGVQVLNLDSLVASGTDVTVTVPRAADAVSDVIEPEVSTGVTISAVPTDAVSDALEPVVTAGVSVTISAVVADSVSDAPAPAVTAATSTTVTVPDAADSVSDAPAPVVSTTSSVTIQAVPADASSDVLAPSVSTGTSVTVTATPADGAGDVLSPTVSATSTATVSGVIADAVSDVLEPTITAGAITIVSLDRPADAVGDMLGTTVSRDWTIAAPVVDAVSDAPAPAISTTTSVDVTINAVPADSVGDALPPAVSVGQSATVSAVPADAASDALPPQVSTGTTVSGAVADATGDLVAPAVTAAQSVTVAAVAADAVSDALPPTITAVSGTFVTITVPRPADGTSDMTASTVVRNTVISGQVADGIGDAVPARLGLWAEITVVPADGLGDALGPTTSTGSTLAPPVADGAGDFITPAINFPYYPAPFTAFFDDPGLQTGDLDLELGSAPFDRDAPGTAPWDHSGKSYAEWDTSRGQKAPFDDYGNQTGDLDGVTYGTSAPTT